MFQAGGGVSLGSPQEFAGGAQEGPWHFCAVRLQQGGSCLKSSVPAGGPFPVLWLERAGFPWLFFLVPVVISGVPASSALSHGYVR